MKEEDGAPTHRRFSIADWTPTRDQVAKVIFEDNGRLGRRIWGWAMPGTCAKSLVGQVCSGVCLGGGGVEWLLV